MCPRRKLCIYYYAAQTYVVHDRVEAVDGLWTSQILFDLKCSGAFRLPINRNSLVLWGGEGHYKPLRILFQKIELKGKRQIIQKTCYYVILIAKEI